MAEERHIALRHEAQIDVGRTFLSFLREMDRNVESYIETVEAIREHPGIAKRLRKASAGRYMSLEKFAKRHGL